MKFDKQDNCPNDIIFQLHNSPLVFAFAIFEMPTMLISGLTVEPRNLVCTQWFSDNTFLRQGLKIDQDFSSPCFICHIFNHSTILMTGFIFCVTYIFLLSYLFFVCFLSIFFLCLLYPFFLFHIPFSLLSHTSLTHFHTTNRQVEKNLQEGTLPQKGICYLPTKYSLLCACTSADTWHSRPKVSKGSGA